MPNKDANYAAVHASLKAILQKFEKGGLKPASDEPGNYVLTGPPSDWSRGRDL